MKEGSLHSIDYNLHDLVGIRLLDAAPGDAKAVQKQIGFPPAPLSREPDIIIRFVEHMATEDMRYLGLDAAGYTPEDFYVLRSSKKPAKVRIPFETIGQQCEIVCESGLKSVPLLIAILNLTLLSKGYVSLHASAFSYRGLGVLVTGWAKGGKTEALLAFGKNGAEYVGDEWIILSHDGQAMYGIPEPIRIWQWHLEHLPHVHREIRLADKGVFAGINFLDGLQKRLPRGSMGRLMPVKVLREAMPALRRQLNVQLKPELLFPGGVGSLQARPDKLFLVMGHARDDIRVDPVSAEDIARRMVASLEFEAEPLMSHYQAFKFAFPDRRNELIERAGSVQLNLLLSALQDKEAYTVCHPYPFSFDALFERMLPYCQAPAAAVDRRSA